LKNYYFTLGLSIYARDAEIKSMYRKLALKFHPDKNAAPEAESIFKEINEAYEVLSDPQRKLLYDQMLVGVEPQVESSLRPHRDPRYHPKPPGFARQRNSMRERLFDFMSINLKYAIIGSRLALAYSIIVVADFSFNAVKDKLEIVDRKSIYEGRVRSIKILLEDGHTLRLSGRDVTNFQIGADITVYSSPILSVPIKVEDEKLHLVARVPISMYGNFIFVPLVLLITSLAGIFYRKGIEHQFNLGVMNFLLLFFNFLCLRIHTF
jgi:DnaJ domain